MMADDTHDELEQREKALRERLDALNIKPAPSPAETLWVLVTIILVAVAFAAVAYLFISTGGQS